MRFVGIHFLLFFAAFSLGWIFPLVVGIRRARTQEGGVGWIVLGSVWGFFALCGMGLACLAFFSIRTMERASEVATFDPSSFEGATGTIVSPAGGDFTLRVSDAETGDSLELRGTNGTLVAPAGSLKLGRYEFSAKEADGVTWQASAYAFKGGSGTITVPEGDRVELQVGVPLRTTVKTRAAGDGRQSFDLTVTGKAGNRFTVRGRSRQSVAPGFEVLSDAGQVVWSGKFAYG